MKGTRRGLTGYLATAAAATIWGSNGVIVNFVALDPYQIAFFRVFFASLVLAPFILLFKRREFADARRFLSLLLFNGMLLCLGWGFLFASMKLIPIADAVLLNYLAPIFTAALAPIILKERLEKIAPVAIMLSMFGTILISYNDIMRGGASNFLGILYGVLAGLTYAGFIISSKKLREKIPSIVLAFYSYTFAAAFLAPTVLWDVPLLKTSSLTLLLILGSINTALAVTLYFYGLGLIKAHKAVIMTYLEPASAVIFGALFLEQIPSLSALAGGLLIVLAGYLVIKY
ncbi:MAG TPA: hypothetical protein ENG21_05330 [Nitrososphaeria archaeon]|nr:hypothetical protein [Nitrososphaeria archaeon]